MNQCLLQVCRDCYCSCFCRPENGSLICWLICVGHVILILQRSSFRLGVFTCFIMCLMHLWYMLIIQSSSLISTSM